MKKAEELKLYAPEPKRPELDAALCMSVAEGQGMGRYIEGKVLTVAVWDKKEKPLVVWRFFGDYWTGELRGNENPTKGELSPRQIEVKPCQCLTWRTEVPATKGESELLQNYFDDCRPGYLIGIVEDALSAHARKKREERNARQAAETKKLFENLPEPPEDLSKQVLKVCSDAGFLWVTNDKQNVIEPGGVEKKISIQRARCDSCGGEYTLSELFLDTDVSVDFLYLNDYQNPCLLEEVFRVCVRRTTLKSVFVVHGICYSKEMRAFWKRLQADERVGITFDLYDIGLLFFDKTKIKQHYIVNF